MSHDVLVSLSTTAWSLALVGIVVESTPLRHRTRLSTGLYLRAGWIGALAVPLLRRTLRTATLVSLVLGGVAYTAGCAAQLAMHSLEALSGSVKGA
ncbi:MAG: hypothetical protein ACK6CU_27665 [Deltaproteobacteria bacterium]